MKCFKPSVRLENTLRPVALEEPSVAHVDDEVAILGSSNAQTIKASELNFQVGNVAQQLTIDRCSIAVRRH